MEDQTKQLFSDASTIEEKIDRIVGFTSNLGEAVADESLDDMRFGGTEEPILDRGSDWCTEIGRVACVLCQLVGLPSRLVMIFDTEQAYCGHVIIEVHRDGVWAAVDPLNTRTYRDGSKPAST